VDGPGVIVPPSALLRALIQPTDWKIRSRYFACRGFPKSALGSRGEHHVLAGTGAVVDYARVGLLELGEVGVLDEVPEAGDEARSGSPSVPVGQPSSTASAAGHRVRPQPRPHDT
jgi:hypothetical protein